MSMDVAAMMPSRWNAQQLTGCFGAEISGASLSDPDAASEVLGLLLTYRVLVVRGQGLGPADQVALAHQLGTPTPAHPVIPSLPGFPEILPVDGALGGKNARWHTDVTFVPRPPAASILVADELPDHGGDTLFADMRTAYLGLAPAMRNMIDGLSAVHRITPLAYWGEPFDSALGRDDALAMYEQSKTVPPVVHPVVRIHPSTGLASLFVNPGFTSHIAGFSRHESDGVLKVLYEHTTQPEFVLRHRWEVGDVLIWDNQATMHYATDDYGTSTRRLRRVTLAGSEPVGPTGVVSHISNDPLLTVR
jgi:alpha-ketoglutarate-dependent sulfate ester dioxygenase